MTPEQIVLEVLRLNNDERKRVINLIIDSMVPPSGELPVHKGQRGQRSVLEFEGVGAHAREQRQSQDAQDYINQLRSEWDHRP